MPPTRERRWWTTQEDDILKREVQGKSTNPISPLVTPAAKSNKDLHLPVRQGGSVQNWNDIAMSLPGRTNKDCRKRWAKIQVDIRKGAWTQEEDERLQKAVLQLGCKSLILGRRSRHAQSNGSNSSSRPLPETNDEEMANNSPEVNDEDESCDGDGDDVFDECSECGMTDSSGNQKHQLLVDMSLLSEEPVEATELGPTSTIIPDYRHSDTFLAVPALELPGTTFNMFDQSCIGTSDHSSGNSAIQTPDSDWMSWLNSLETDTSVSLESRPSWWDEGPTDQSYFHDSSYGSLDVNMAGISDTCHSSRARKRVKGETSPRASLGPVARAETPSKDNGQMGLVTLSLDQVDPIIANEIIGSVMKHNTVIILVQEFQQGPEFCHFCAQRSSPTWVQVRLIGSLKCPIVCKYTWWLPQFKFSYPPIFPCHPDTYAPMSSFRTPKVSLEPASTSGLRTLPELVDFHAESNPKHLFCLQAEANAAGNGHNFVPLSYETLQRAIVRCQAWLKGQATTLHAPKTEADGSVKKCAPVAVLMESHVGLVICVLACMGMGVPVILLSARLSAPSARHLIRETGAKLALVSPRLLPLAFEAVGAENQDGNEIPGESTTMILSVSGYESFLADEPAEDQSRTLRAANADHYVSEDDRQVLILHSSGTSGLPKPIPCSHQYFLSYATCHSFESTKEAHGLTVSTLPFFHGFGFVSVCLSLNIGKTFCAPVPSTIPNGASVAALIEDSQAKALLTVPSILEEIEGLPDGRGHDILRKLDYAGFGGGRPKTSVGERLERSGVRLVGQYGATETGPMTPFFVPGKEHDWRRLRLRADILGPLQVKLDLIDADAEESAQTESEAERSYSYKLSMKPFGWQERFELQDIIVARTECASADDAGQLDFVIAGRKDDLICLATGEKVRPTILESLLRQHEDVRDATAFGEGQFELGVIVEPVRPVGPSEVANFKASIWPAIEEAGRQMDAHAKITSSTAILIVAPEALPRSDKGTVLRSAVSRKFADEMAAVYRDLEASMVAPPIDLSSPASSIRNLVTQDVLGLDNGRDWDDDDDFFSRGMDSLQATRLRRLLTASLRATYAAAEPGAANLLATDMIRDDIVYRNPSVNKLVEALIPSSSKTNGVIAETKLIEQLVDKYSSRGNHREQRKSVVLLTGGTGSLGSFFVGRLLADDNVSNVICLNRPGKGNPTEAQKHAVTLRKVFVDESAWKKLEVYETNTADQWLGLPEAEYLRLAARVAHLVHIAWPMNFKMGLQSFEASFSSLLNLIQLARQASIHQTRKPKLLLISSISTVGNYPSIKGQTLIPETSVEDQSWTLDLGYAKAKLVCEKIIERTAQDHPEIEAAVVRVGQIAGSSTGYWNASEHFVAVCASSQKLGKFPDLRGTLSWLPVDLAAEALSEILFHQEPLSAVYHLENAARQSWEEVVRLISEELRISSSSIIPLETWLDLVDALPGPGNPASGLTQFLREDFAKMSCGFVVLDTSNSRNVSSTMANMTSVGEESIRSYVSYWKSIKMLA
ncbi:hypothetical protein CSIM01_12181 [Colletotrichum simmondsii]|uniref:Myb-like domain-containing protein n=1 Tax=Colletotrichum simmondsii TaxID=703756 RepID=A0A135T7D2_9PEZI|nr:hypothetical protein CSIM01_12181 [Colletotrichum simmondsii]